MSGRASLRGALLGLGAALLAGLVILLAPGLAGSARNLALDRLAGLRAAGPDTVAVITIDERATAAIGPWPWPRAALAELIAAVSAGKPSAIALDILVSGNCDAANSGNAALAAAIGKAPVTLGFVLPGPDAAPPPKATIAVRPGTTLPGLWREAGAELPCPQFLEAAQGFGVMSMAGDDSATVRAVPAAAAVGNLLYPGLAVDAVRVAEGAGTMILTPGWPAALAIGARRVSLSGDAAAMLPASSQELWSRRDFSAADILAAPPGLAGRIAVVGVSLPQLGTLRPTVASPLTPTAEIHADMIRGLLAGTVPWRPDMAGPVEALAAVLAGGLAAAAAIRIAPVAALAVTLVLALAWAAAAVSLFLALGLMLDPLTPALGIAGAGLAAGASQYAASRAGEQVMRRSLEQRLPAAVVARLSRSGRTRMEPEERVVTALFTDIEGFTELTRRAGARELVKLLDGYFEGVARIVADHGGMIDKIVGDAAHAFFNMPLDLADHEKRALDCAADIARFAEDYRRLADPARYGFGRTRIGIETGPALVGDVGAEGKFDYSAHGPAVNLAARLQEANKMTGTAILAGPGLRAACPPGWAFDSLGVHDLRGAGRVELFSPRPLSPDRSEDRPPRPYA